MSKKRSKLDGQLDLFNVYETLQKAREMTTGGSLNIRYQLKSLISEGLKFCPLSRHQVAAQMSELTGVEITKFMLDTWTAESKDNHRFPAEFLPAFCRVTGFYDLLRFLVEKAGCYLIEGEDVIYTELGRIRKMQEDLKKREKAIREYLKKIGMEE